MIMMTAANTTDRTGAILMIEYYSEQTKNLKFIKKILADGGYTGEHFADEVKQLCNAKVEIVKRNELHTFAVLPKRWIALLHGWINTADFGKIANAICKLLFRWLLWILSV